MKARHPLRGCECNVCRISVQNLDKIYDIKYLTGLELTKNHSLMIKDCNFKATFCYFGHRRVSLDVMEPQKEREVGVTVFISKLGDEAFIPVNKIREIFEPNSFYHPTYSHESKNNSAYVNNRFNKQNMSAPTTPVSFSNVSYRKTSLPPYPQFSFDFVDGCNSRPVLIDRRNSRSLIPNYQCYQSVSPYNGIPYNVEQIPIYHPPLYSHQCHEIRRSPSPGCVNHRYSPRSTRYFEDSSDSAISLASTENCGFKKCSSPCYDHSGNATTRRCSSPFADHQHSPNSYVAGYVHDFTDSAIFHEKRNATTRRCSSPFADHHHSPRSYVTGYVPDFTAKENYCSRNCFTPTIDQLGTRPRAVNDRRCSAYY